MRCWLQVAEAVDQQGQGVDLVRMAADLQVTKGKPSCMARSCS